MPKTVRKDIDEGGRVAAGSRPQRGVYYIATQLPSFGAEAVLSAWSLKQTNPDLHVTIATDLLGACPAFFEHFFDNVIDASQFLPPLPAVPTWGAGIRRRVRCLQETPYQQTLYVDVDTQICTKNLAQVFRRLDACNIALVEAMPSMSSSRKLWGQRMFLGGVMLYDDAPATRKLLRDWDRYAGEHAALAAKQPFKRPSWMPKHLTHEQARWMLEPSQVSLVRLLSPDHAPRGITAQVLPRVWNYRSVKPDSRPRGVKIDAGSHIRKSLLADLVRLSEWLWQHDKPARARRFDAALRKAAQEGAIFNR
jgi:hypothetical protein